MTCIEPATATATAPATVTTTATATVTATVTPELLSEAAIARRRETVRSISRGSLGRRHLQGRIARAACYGALVVALVPLVALIAYTAGRGTKALSADFFTKSPLPVGIRGGGIANAIVGSGIIVGLALCMAVPVGMAMALYLVDAKSWLAGLLRFVADVMSGIPSIAIGIFAYALIVVPSGHYSGLSASVALAVLMVPIIVRANEEAMRAVPDDLWEAGLALGARQSRVVRSVVVRGALPGIVTGNLLAIARAVGETAPLLFTAIGSTLFTVAPNQPMNALPLVIFNSGTEPYPSMQATAWGAAFVLLGFVLVLSIVARSAASYLTRHAR
jgi:phosphate transport system permease protein